MPRTLLLAIYRCPCGYWPLDRQSRSQCPTCTRRTAPLSAIGGSPEAVETYLHAGLKREVFRFEIKDLP